MNITYACADSSPDECAGSSCEPDHELDVSAIPDELDEWDDEVEVDE